MAINRISYGGQILPCYVERFPAIKKAARKFRQYNIPGRNGDIFFQSDAYENVIQPYEVYIGDETYGAQLDWTEFAKYLYLDGYQELKDTYDPDHFRKAVFNGPVEVENSWNKFGRATLEFNCRPERFRVDGTTPITYAATDSKLTKIEYDDLSDDLQASLYYCDYYYVFAAPANATVVVGNFVPAHAADSIYSVTHGTIGTAVTATTHAINGEQTVSITIAGTAKDIIVPVDFVEDIPQAIVNNVGVGSAGTLINNYMPTFPTIVLKKEAYHADEVLAAHINDHGIYIKGGTLGTYYYFIDTETWTATRAYASINGWRIPSDDIRVDPQIRLEKGLNQIYTSTEYSMTLTPNWWEL